MLQSKQRRFEIQEKKDFEIHTKKTLKSIQRRLLKSKKHFSNPMNTFELKKRVVKSKQRNTYLYLGHVTNHDLQIQKF